MCFVSRHEGADERGVCVPKGLDGKTPLAVTCYLNSKDFSREWRAVTQKAFGFFAGGLAEEVDDKVLHAAFIPFGDITDIQIPLDYETGEAF